jgi:hypothetical protein
VEQTIQNEFSSSFLPERICKTVKRFWSTTVKPWSGNFVRSEWLWGLFCPNPATLIEFIGT